MRSSSLPRCVLPAKSLASLSPSVVVRAFPPRLRFVTPATTGEDSRSRQPEGPTSQCVSTRLVRLVSVLDRDKAVAPAFPTPADWMQSDCSPAYWGPVESSRTAVLSGARLPRLP